MSWSGSIPGSLVRGMTDADIQFLTEQITEDEWRSMKAIPRNAPDPSFSHEMTRDCPCGPTVERYNPVTKEWEDVSAEREADCRD